jgi:hypothetical protein
VGLGKLLELPRCVGTKFSAYIDIGLRKSIVRIVKPQCLYDVLQEESSVVMPSDRLRIAIGIHREF